MTAQQTANPSGAVVMIDVKFTLQLADLTPALDCSHHLLELINGYPVSLDQLLVSIVSGIPTFTYPAIFNVIV